MDLSVLEGFGVEENVVVVRSGQKETWRLRLKRETVGLWRRGTALPIL
jgi:hypothetical protein